MKNSFQKMVSWCGMLSVIFSLSVVGSAEQWAPKVDVYNANFTIVNPSNSSMPDGYDIYVAAGTTATFQRTTNNSHLTWYHVVAVYDPNTSAKIYLNGVLKAIATNNVDVGDLVSHLNNLRIGVGFNGWRWNGRIDEVMVWNNRALSDSGVVDLYNNGNGMFVPSRHDLRTGLVGYWRMDEASWNGSSNEVVDSSDPDYNGRIHDGRAVSGAQTVPNGLLGRAGDFDGVATYVDCGFNNGRFNLGNGPLSISLWFTATSLSSPDAPELFGLAGDSLAGESWHWITLRVDYQDAVEFYLRHQDENKSVQLTTPVSGITTSCEASAYIHNLGPGTASFYTTSKIKVEPGVRYRASVWLQTTNVAGQCGMEILFKDSSSNWIGDAVGVQDTNSNSTAWHKCTFEFLPCIGAAEMVVRLSSWNGNGDEVWFGNIVLEKLRDFSNCLAEWENISSETNYFVGWADSISRVWLRDLPITLQISDTNQLDGVKGETEDVQIVLVALSTDLQNVSVTVGNLTDSSGHTISSNNVSISPVGYVNLQKLSTQRNIPFESGYIGYWPDILFDNFLFSVAQSNSQPVRIGVTIPSETTAGIYTGTVTIQPANAAAVALNISVNVRNIEMPAEWAYKNLMSFHIDFAGIYGAQWSANNYEMRDKFYAFLRTNKINLASIYGEELYGDGFTAADLAPAIQAGQNLVVLSALMNMADFTNTAPYFTSDETAYLNNMHTNLDPIIQSLDNSNYCGDRIIYGFDEMNSNWFECATYVFGAIKASFPGVKTMSTLSDSNYGTDPAVISNVDIFCPKFTGYNEDMAEIARGQGRQVWSYEITWNIEQILLRSRMIPWLTFKLNADGFLIWCLNRWVGTNNTAPIGTQILSSWDPALDGRVTNSSAMYVYPGTNGPLASTRFENFRNGIEDYQLLEMCKAHDISIDFSYLIAGPGASNISYDIDVFKEYRAGLLDALETHFISDNLVGYWRMEEASWNGTSNEVADSSGLDYHGRALSGAQTVTDGKLGRAGLFDGSATYLDCGSNTSRYQIGNTAFSISLWFKAASFSSPDAPELFNIQGPSSHWIQLRVNYNDGVEFFVRHYDDNDKKIQIATANGSVTTGAWYHVVAVYDPNGTSRIYLNGAPNGSTSTLNVGALLPHLTGTLRIGVGFNGWRWNGRIDEVMVWNNRALSDSDVAQLYNGGQGIALTFE